MSKLVPFNKNNELSTLPFGNMLEDFFADPWLPARMPKMATFTLVITVPRQKADTSKRTIEIK